MQGGIHQKCLGPVRQVGRVLRLPLHCQRGFQPLFIGLSSYLRPANACELYQAVCEWLRMRAGFREVWDDGHRRHY
ncbi:hypothetical protein MTO96_025999 [Rhipicephalus appendiculatus]